MAKLMLVAEAAAHEEDDNDPSGPTFSHCCRRWIKVDSAMGQCLVLAICTVVYG